MARSEVVHIALTFADGTLGAMQMVVAQYIGDDQNPVWTREPTTEAVEDEIRKLSASDPETGNVALEAHRIPIKKWRFCAVDEFPIDRTYRNAWRDTGKRIAHDMPHAREIHRDLLRYERGPLLAALDVEYQRADEKDLGGGRSVSGARKKSDIAAEKQRLRDAPADPRIEKATTVEQLKALTLETLTADK